jgi:hypothetical protein
MYRDDGLDLYGLPPDVGKSLKGAVFTSRADHHAMDDGDWKIKALRPSTNQQFMMWVTPKGITKPHHRLISESPEQAKVQVAAWLDELYAEHK